MSADSARKLLRLQSEALLRCSEGLSADYNRAVELVLQIPESGRLIVSGMGKAGFVAMKISATFASTGVPSFFLHPAEAVHGDLGRFHERDSVIVLSNSGETEEVIRMLPYIKRVGCPIIAITGNLTSTLASHSDVYLNIGKVLEAGPLGLAPTTSTTLMLALGDALAMSVLEERKFTPEDFAKFHPGGNLGRSLMQVSELMRTGDRQCVVASGTPSRDVLHAITATAGRPGAAAIVDNSGRLVGVFTDGDLRRCLEKEPKFLDQPIDLFMGTSPKTIQPESLIQEALRQMTHLKIDQLIVVNDQHHPIGLVDIQDLAAV
ncbi:MAG: KpsF/GutQ family sugar-phosphate isomerase [Bdellovibrionales bacterium]|nr:KpsF/GutQ family sugar-phosphate isomerase [Bdellovibrionales bacterium]